VTGVQTCALPIWLPCGTMRYIVLILCTLAFVIWDVSSNRSQITGPAAWFAYRVAGGH